MDHVKHCLGEFEPARSLADNPDAVELALWFHDAVYDTHASDNEVRSAQLVRALPVLSGGVVDRAARLIPATRHADPVDDLDARLFVDVDLAILGQADAVFDLYEVQIRKEYAWVPGFLFRRKRVAILRAFLARPFLYGTEYFRSRYESRARANLERSITRMKS